MPRFKVAKSDNKTKIENNEKTEDKLYIYKETNKLGRLFFNYDENTRIEIGALDNVYTTNSDLINDVEILNVNYLKKYGATDTLNNVSIDEVQVNSLVTNNKSLYNIRVIDRSTKNLTLRKIYEQQDLAWNDYY